MYYKSVLGGEGVISRIGTAAAGSPAGARCVDVNEGLESPQPRKKTKSLLYLYLKFSLKPINKKLTPQIMTKK